MNDTKAIEALSALAHPARLAVFKLLVQIGSNGLPAGDIARQLEVPVTTMSSHLGILSRAGVIVPRRQSRTIFYALDVGGTRDLFSYLLADCCGGRPDLCTPVFAATQLVCCPPQLPIMAQSPILPQPMSSDSISVDAVEHT
jgi:ArsR family transcriptional regulator, arsenate/arsenite/antimonite-responsive transcriptional repressor